MLAAVFALFAKERLVGFLLREGGPLTERRTLGIQRDVETLKSWPYNYLLKAPRALLHIALLFPPSGLAPVLWFPNFGIMFFLVVVVGPGLVGYAMIGLIFDM